MTDAQIGDTGSIFRFTVTELGEILPLATATTKQIILRKRNKEVLVKDADFTTDGSDGKIEFITSGSDLDVKGTWKGQVYLEFPDGSWHTSIVDIEVGENLV